ncbi:MAG: methyltransferase domain-containing protein [Defluviitaleaceae bacterium]|nr:methyltransferase domain-containing protein [Defluviitaleaceae bacterium]MCL2274412.1 methyltransferase domain-containing protein [Defluviitaleaceae bacterium]
MTLQEKFNHAHVLYQQKKYEEAAAIYIELQVNKEVAPACYYSLAAISNATGDPEAAYNLYYKALAANPKLALALFKNTHSSHGYVYRGKKEEDERLQCVFCNALAKPYWCYPLLEAQGYNPLINPIRMWMYCQSCHHMFARHFPKKIFMHNTDPRNANPSKFPYYSQLLGNIRARGFAQGMELFEIGIGASECLLAAREIGYNTFGIDVIERHVEEAKKRYGLEAETADINEYETTRQWDVIIMGDVLEHVSDPEGAMHKIRTLLKDDGAVWISTPSFESAFSAVVEHEDAMRRQQYHLNYFSRESLYALLERCGLMPVDYHISAYYSGSMEVVAVKNA